MQATGIDHKGEIYFGFGDIPESSPRDLPRKDKTVQLTRNMKLRRLLTKNAPLRENRKSEGRNELLSILLTTKEPEGKKKKTSRLKKAMRDDMLVSPSWQDTYASFEEGREGSRLVNV